jgi:hypothetical protein
LPGGFSLRGIQVPEPGRAQVLSILMEIALIDRAILGGDTTLLGVLEATGLEKIDRV